MQRDLFEADKARAEQRFGADRMHNLRDFGRVTDVVLTESGATFYFDGGALLLTLAQYQYCRELFRGLPKATANDGHPF